MCRWVGGKWWFGAQSDVLLLPAEIRSTSQLPRIKPRLSTAQPANRQSSLPTKSLSAAGQVAPPPAWRQPAKLFGWQPNGRQASESPSWRRCAQWCGAGGRRRRPRHGCRRGAERARGRARGGEGAVVWGRGPPPGRIPPPLPQLCPSCAPSSQEHQCINTYKPNAAQRRHPPIHPPPPTSSLTCTERSGIHGPPWPRRPPRRAG